MKNRYFLLFTLRTFRNLLASYALLFLMPLLVSFLIYLASVSLISRETEAANRASLLLLKQVVDAKLTELAIAADQFSISEKVQSIAAADLPVSIFQRMDMKEVQTFLQQVKIANSLIGGIYLYLPKTRYILSNVSRYKGDEFEMEARKIFGMTMVEWETMMESGGYRRLVALPPAGASVGASTGTAAGSVSAPSANTDFVFAQKFIFGGSDRIPAVIAFTIDRNVLATLLDTVKWDRRAQLVIVAPDGSFASNTASSPLPEWLGYGTIGKGYSKSEKMYQKGRHIVAGIGSDLAELRYVGLLPADIYGRSVAFIKRVMLAYVLVCLCGGFLLSYFMAKKNYTPIRRLTRIFLDRLGDSDGGDGNNGDEEGSERDFPFLEGALRRLLQEHADLEDTIHKQNETARSSLLSRLIECPPSQTAGLLESCKACGIEFATGNFILLAAVVDDEGATIAGQGMPGDTGSEALVRYMLHHTLTELVGERHIGYVTDAGGLVMCLASLSVARGQDPGWEETYEEMAAITRKVRDLFRGKFGIGLSFAASGVHENPSAIPVAAAEIDRIVESIVLFDKRDVTIMAGDTATQPTAAESLSPAAGSLALHRTIADLACTGNFTSVSVEVGKYLEREFSDSQMPLATAKLRMSGVMNIISEVLSDLRSSLDRGFLEELNPVDRLSHVKSIPELQRQVDEIFAHLEAHFRERKEEQPICLKDQATRYVEENFRDRNLNVNAIADRFGVSASHLSRAFKKEAGIGLLDYLHIIRVREAKVLMGEGCMNIEEIAGAVGCGSRITLARAFKRYEGVAPAVFRDRE